MIAFWRGARTPVRITSIPAAVNTASKPALNDRVAVVDQELRPRAPGVVEVHQQVPGLLRHPLRRRMEGGTQHADPPGGVLDHRQDVRLGAVEQVDHDEVAGARIASAWERRNCRPGRTRVPARGRIDPGGLEDLPHRGRRDADAEAGQLAVDPPVAPRGILAGQPQHQGLDAPVGRRTPRTLAPRAPGPAAAQQVAVPAQQRARRDDQPEPRRAGRRAAARPAAPATPGRPRSAYAAARAWIRRCATAS